MSELTQEEISEAVQAAIKEVVGETPTALEEQYRKDAAALIASPNKSMNKLRALQQKYRDQGVPEDVLDISPKGSAVAPGRLNDLPGR